MELHRCDHDPLNTGCASRRRKALSFDATCTCGGGDQHNVNISLGKKGEKGSIELADDCSCFDQNTAKLSSGFGSQSSSSVDSRSELCKNFSTETGNTPSAVVKVDRLIPPLSPSSPFSSIVERVTNGDPLCVHLWMPQLQAARFQQNVAHPAGKWDLYWPTTNALQQWLRKQLSHLLHSTAERAAFLDYFRLLGCRIGPKQLVEALVNEQILRADDKIESGSQFLYAIQVAALWSNCDCVDLLMDSFTAANFGTELQSEPIFFVSACKHCRTKMLSLPASIISQPCNTARSSNAPEALALCKDFSKWGEFLIAIHDQKSCPTEFLQQITLELCRLGSSYYPLLYALYAVDSNLFTSTSCGNFSTALGVAVQRNNTLLVEVLLALFKVPVNTRFSDSSHTALHIAAKYDFTECVQILLAYGANPCVYDTDRCWPIDLLRRTAPQHSQEEAVKLLKAAQNQRQAALTNLVQQAEQTHEHKLAQFSSDDFYIPLDDKGRVLLSLAAVRGNEFVVRELLGNTNIDQNILDMRDLDGNTALSNAIVAGHIGVVQLLLDVGASGRLANVINQVPLELAVLHKHYDIFELLLDFSTCWTRLVSLLKSTIRNNNYGKHHDFVVHSLKHAYNMRQRKIITPLLFECAANGDVQKLIDVFEPEEDCVNLIAEENEQIGETCAIAGEWPLYTAARCGQIEVAAFLLENGAHYTNKHPTSKDTVFHVACWQNNVEMLKLLVSMCCSNPTPTAQTTRDSGNTPTSVILDAVNRDGLTALHIAACRVHSTHCVRVLLDAGASAAGLQLNPNADIECALHNAREKTTSKLFDAVETGCVSRVKAALRSAFDLNLRNTAGDTPIMVAARLAATIQPPGKPSAQNSIQVLQFLLQHAVHQRVDYVYTGEQYRNDGFVDWLIFNPAVRPPASWQLEDDDEFDDDPTTSSGTSSPNDLQDEEDVSNSSKNEQRKKQLVVVDIEALAQKRRHAGETKCWLARANVEKQQPKVDLTDAKSAHKGVGAGESLRPPAPPKKPQLGLRRSKTMMTFADLRNSIQADQLRADWNVLRFLQSLEITARLDDLRQSLPCNTTTTATRHVAQCYHNHVCTRSTAHDGRTAIHRALEAGDCVAVLRLLVAASTDAANIADCSHGFTPLHLAAALGREHCLLFLLDCGMCDLTATALDGATPEEVACTPRLRSLITRKRMNPFAPLPRAAKAEMRQKLLASRRQTLVGEPTAHENDRTVVWTSDNSARRSSNEVGKNGQQPETSSKQRRSGTLRTLWLHGMSSALLSFRGRLSIRNRCDIY